MKIYFQAEARRKRVGSRRKQAEAKISLNVSTAEAGGSRRKHGFPSFAYIVPHKICGKGKGEIPLKGYPPSPPAKCAEPSAMRATFSVLEMVR